jgi:hypothetical protein
MELIAVRFETNCRDDALLKPVVEKLRRARELGRAEVRKGAIGLDLYVPVEPGVTVGRAQGVVAPLVPPGVLISRTFEVMGERSEEDDAPERDDAAEADASASGQGST